MAEGVSNGEKNFVPLLRRAVDILAQFCFQGSFPILGWVNALTGFDSKVRKVSREVNDFQDTVIDDHKKRVVVAEDDRFR
ncbi:unnamed protein product [Linum trigynum]|uniref:Uncharacterized protein n=1 Tax=Linum trigynum TaxID=586398 RepID=A0AAV2GG98_9ROSI